MLELKFEEARKHIVDIAEKTADALSAYTFIKGPVEDFIRVFDEKRRETRLHVAVCGAYSSGKSTLVSFLTGRKDIKIGQGIVTDQTSEYECDDWMIVDTPGICAGRPSHDEKSLKYMERADLLLYMIPSKGFSPEVEKNFKETILNRYADKTMLVMGRLSDVEVGNLANKKKDVAEVLGDEALLDKFRFCMLDVQDYLLGVEDNDEELIVASRMVDFREKLDDFLKQRGALGKCLALLDVLEGFVNGATEICQSKQSRDEVASRQRKAVKHALTKYRRSFMEAKARMVDFITRERAEMLSLFSESSSEVEEKIKTLPSRLEKAADDEIFQSEQESIFDELKTELDFVNDQILRLDKRLADACAGMSGAGPAFDFEKWKAGIGKLGEALTGMSKNSFVKIVHFFGGKFKPWGATKWMNCLKTVGKALPFVTETISTVCEEYNEKKEDDARREMNGNFDEIEKMVCAFYDNYENTESYRWLKEMEDKLDNLEKERQATNKDKDDALKRLLEVKGTIERLRGIAG